MPKKPSNDTPLVLRRMPIVVIPRKRKYKNYVSRRRNTHLLASLRKCVSDPHLYRSFNHWKALWREFSPVQEPAASPSADVPRLIDEEEIPRTPVVTNAMVAPSANARRSPLFKQFAGKMTQLKKNEVSQAALHVPLPTPRANLANLPRRPLRTEPSPKASSLRAVASTTQKQGLDPKGEYEEVNNVHSEDKDSTVKLSSFTEAGVPKSSALLKSGAPSPASFPKASPESEKSTATSNNKARGAKMVVTELPPIEPRNAGATPSAPKALRKAYGSKSGTTICAIGSPLTAASTTNNINVEDQRIIEKKVTLRKRKEQVKENAAVQVPSKCQMDIGEKSSQADEQKAKKTVNAVAAAFSTQSVSIDVPESLKVEEKKELEKDVVQPPVKAVTSATANLLAQLQLPPTVSAKVDKIIASGQKSRLQKQTDQVHF